MNNYEKVSTNNYYKTDLRITKTHRLLVRALVKLLEEKPFSKISVKDICEEALVSRSGFYSHFEDKYHLLLYCLEDLKQEISDQLDFNDKTLLLDRVIDFIQSNDRLFHSLFNDDTSLELQKMLQSTFTGEIEEFLQVKQTIEKEDFPVPIPIMAVFLAGGITQVIHWWVESDFKEPKETIHQLLSQIM